MNSLPAWLFLLPIACSPYHYDSSEGRVWVEPVADAGPDRIVEPLVEFELDGSASYDAGLELQTYRWTAVSVPAQSSFEIDPDAAQSVRPALTVDLVGDYIFDLTVQNTAGNWDSTPDTTLVTAEVSR